MFSSIKFEDLGYFVIKKYGKYAIGKARLRTYINGKSDIDYFGIHISETRFNPYCFITRQHIDTFIADNSQIAEAIFAKINNGVRELYATIQIFLEQFQSHQPINDEHSCYINFYSANIYYLGEPKEKCGTLNSYRVLLIQKRDDGITMKIKEHEPFGRPSDYSGGHLVECNAELFNVCKSSIMAKAAEYTKLIENSI